MKLYYHGSPKLFSQLRVQQSKGGPAVFITDDAANAKSYGKYLYTLALDAGTKLFDYRAQSDIARLSARIEALLTTPAKSYGSGNSFYPYTWKSVLEGIKRGDYNHLGQPLVMKALKSLKYDGYYENENGTWSGVEQLAILNPKRLTILKVEEWASPMAARVASRYLRATDLGSNP
jgi:hypothetical protein